MNYNYCVCLCVCTRVKSPYLPACLSITVMSPQEGAGRHFWGFCKPVRILLGAETWPWRNWLEPGNGTIMQKCFPLERELLKDLPTHHGVVKKGTSQFISQGKQYNQLKKGSIPQLNVANNLINRRKFHLLFLLNSLKLNDKVESISDSRTALGCL